MPLSNASHPLPADLSRQRALRGLGVALRGLRSRHVAAGNKARVTRHPRWQHAWMEAPVAMRAVLPPVLLPSPSPRPNPTSRRVPHRLLGRIFGRCAGDGHVVVVGLVDGALHLEPAGGCHPQWEGDSGHAWGCTGGDARPGLAKLCPLIVLQGWMGQGQAGGHAGHTLRLAPQCPPWPACLPACMHACLPACLLPHQPNHVPQDRLTSWP